MATPATPEEIGDAIVDGLTELRVQVMRRVVLTVERNVKKNTRVRTGHLRQSWTSRVERAGERGRVGTTVQYARYQKNKPLHEGLDDSRTEIARILREAGDELFDKVSG